MDGVSAPVLDRGPGLPDRRANVREGPERGMLVRFPAAYYR